MSPTPTTFASPTKPASWSWEATSESVAARYGLPVEQVVRFDQNTAPSPPDAVRELLAAGRFEVELSEYPPSDYRRLVEAAGERYGVAFEELLVGAGADEILDLAAKAFLPAGGAAIVPMPTYPMYGILTDQRRAAVVRVPRRDRSADYALDVDAIRAAAAEPADNGALPGVIWLCSPNNPTGRAEPAGASRTSWPGWRATRTPPGVPTRPSSSMRRTSSSRVPRSRRSARTTRASSSSGR